MLGLVKARQIYNDNPQDPYVVLPNNERIEIRFAEDGTITGAISIEKEPHIRWYSGEMRDYLDKQRGGFNSVVQRKEERVEEINKAQKLESPRKAQRVGPYPPRRIGRPIVRPEDF